MDIDRYERIVERIASPLRVRAVSMPLPDERALPNRQSGTKARAVKWILDGTPFEHGAALRTPYHDRPGFSGTMNFSSAEVREIVGRALESENPLLLHAAGDGTAEAVLEALEQRSDVEWRVRRVRIEHGDGVTADLIPRARALGVVIVQNPTHFALVDLIHARYGSDTAFFPLRTLVENGVPVAIGSDGPINPYLNIMLASLHPIRPSEAITREQAVDAYTHGSAYAAFVENERGRLEPGKLADLAVLSQDIFTASPDSLPATESLLTLIGGEIVYGTLPLP